MLDASKPEMADLLRTWKSTPSAVMASLKEMSSVIMALPTPTMLPTLADATVFSLVVAMVFRMLASNAMELPTVPRPVLSTALALPTPPAPLVPKPSMSTSITSSLELEGPKLALVSNNALIESLICID